MQVQAYLSFEGRCEEALEFYKKALGATDISIMRFKESPEPGMTPPGSGDKVMHCSFRVGETMLMASDGNCGGNTQFGGIALTLSPKSVAEAERFFAALSEGGKVQMPMTKTFFSPSFGMTADKFGVSWMVMAEA